MTVLSKKNPRISYSAIVVKSFMYLLNIESWHTTTIMINVSLNNFISYSFLFRAPICYCFFFSVFFLKKLRVLNFGWPFNKDKDN